MNLSRRYTDVRLEAACKRALFIRSTSYTSISSILGKGLDKTPLQHEEDKQDKGSNDLPEHHNLRGAAYYH